MSLWDCADWKKREICPGSGCYGVAFSPDGKTLAAGMGGVTLLDAATGEERLCIPKAGGNSLAFSPDGKTVATGAHDQMVRLWDIATGQERRVLKGHLDWVWWVAFSPDGKTLASAGRDGSLRMWDLTSEPEGEVRGDPPAAGSKPSLIAFSPDGKTMATARADGSVSLSVTTTAHETASFSTSAGSITALALAAGGKTLAVALYEGGKPVEVRLWDTEKKQHRSLDSPPGAPCFVLVFSPDGVTLAGGAGNEVRLWDVPSGKLCGTLTGHVSEVMSLVFAPDGKRLAVGTRAFRETKPSRAGFTLTKAKYGEVRVWDIPSQRKQAAFRWTFNNPGVAFSPDGKLLAAAGSDYFQAAGGGKARVWEVGTWREVVTLEGHRRSVTCVAFSSDGKLLTTAGEDGAVRLWDTTTWQERLVLKWPDQSISGLSLAADMTTLTATSRGSVRVWRAGREQEILESVGDAALRTWAHWLRCAHYDSKSEDLERVVLDYSKAIELRPDEPLAWELRATAQRKLRRWNEAIADNTEAIRLVPRNAQPYNNRGTVYNDQGQWDKAIVDYNEAIQLEPEYVTAYLNRGVAYGRKGDWDKAIADFSDAIRLVPELATAHNNRGDAYWRKGDWDKAIADCSEAIRLDPGFASAYNTRGFAYAALGDEEKAKADWQQARQLADWQQARQLDPTLAQFYFKRATVTADPQTRVAEYTKSIQLDPKSPWAFSRRGRAYFDLQQFAQALADFDKRIELQPSDTLTMPWRAMIYQRLGTLDVALADAKKAIQREPGNRNQYCSRSILFRQKGAYELALADLQKVIDFGPEQDRQWFGVTKALEMRGDIYLMNLKDYDKAIEEYKKVQALEPLNAVAMNYAGTLLLSDKTEEYRQACVETLERFGSSNNAAELTQAVLCCVLAPDAVTDPMQPVKLAERAVAMASKSMASLHVLGMTYLRTGQFDLAARNFHESLEAQPELYANFNNRLGLSLVHYRRGEIEAARRWFAEATEWIDQHPDECMLVARSWLEKEILRREAEALLKSTPAPPSSEPAAKEKEKTEEKPKADSGKQS